MRAATLSLVLITLPACSPAQRVAAGAGIGGAGLVTSYAALASMVPSCRQQRGNNVCVEYDEPTPPSVAAPVAFAGLGAVALGSLLVAKGVNRRQPPPSKTYIAVVLPPQPTPLDTSEAVGMAIAHLVVTGIDGDGKPSKLLDVDDALITLNVEGTEAELANLRVHTAPDGEWRMLTACYEFERAWRLTALGTNPVCIH